MKAHMDPVPGFVTFWNGELSFFGLVKHEVKTENVDKNGYLWMFMADIS
jgi:hypothetical protein